MKLLVTPVFVVKLITFGLIVGAVLALYLAHH
jgi:hypothetical protein